MHITQRTNALGELPTSALSFANLTQILDQRDRRIIAARTLRGDERLDLPPGGDLALRQPTTTLPPVECTSSDCPAA